MLPVRTSVPDRAWMLSWVPEVQFGPATGVPEKVRGVEFRLGAVPQMVPPVIVRPPVVSEMLSAAESLSVRVPPLVRERSFVAGGLLPLFPSVGVPSTVDEPLEDVVNADPVVVLPSRMPLALVVSKLPLLVKVVPAPTMSSPSASCNSPLLVTDVVVETTALSTMV